MKRNSDSAAGFPCIEAVDGAVHYVIEYYGRPDIRRCYLEAHIVKRKPADIAGIHAVCR